MTKRRWAMVAMRRTLVRLPGASMILGAVMILVTSMVLGIGGCSRSTQLDLPASTSQRSSGDRLSQARRLFDGGELDRAEEIVRQFLVAEPSHQRGLILAADIQAKRGEPLRAVALLDDAAEKVKQRGARAALKTRAAELLMDVDARQAAFRWSKLASMEPGKPRYHRMAAEAFNQTGYRFDANEHLRTLARLVPLNTDELWSLMNPIGSYVEVPADVDIESTEIIESPNVLSVVRALFARGELRQALKLIDSIGLDAADGAAVSLHGRILLESQQFELLQAWLPDSSTPYDRYPDYCVAAGGLALQKRRPDLAVGMFASALRREPMDQQAAYRMTQALETVGDFEGADVFRSRCDDIKGLAELAGDILQFPAISPQAFEVVSRELSRIGMVFEAFSWELLKRQRSALQGEPIADDALTRRRLLDANRPGELVSKRVCDLNLDRFPMDALVLREGAVSEDSKTQSPPPAKGATARFVNIAKQSGLEFRYRNSSEPVERHFLLHQALGGSIACLDYDLDGNVDLYVAQGGCDPPEKISSRPNLLARNAGGQFIDVTGRSGSDDRRYSMGVTSGDWNQDGFPDLVIGNLGRNQLFLNQGDGTFVAVAIDAGLSDGKFTLSTAIADITGDHLPEIIEANYTDDQRIFRPIQYFPDGSPVRLPGPTQFDPSVDRYFIATDANALEARPLVDERRTTRCYGMGLLVTDFDGELGNEVFVGNDQTPNHLWKRNAAPEKGVGEFLDVAVGKGVAYGRGGTPNACMGIAAADFDRNSRIDLHVTNFDDEWSNLYMQSDDGFFTDVALPMGIDHASIGLVGFGTQPIDFDNNTKVDLIVGNGHIEDLRPSGSAFRMPTQLLVMADDSFVSADVTGDPAYWNSNHLTRSLVKLDWNRDGRLDFAAVDLSEPVVLMENATETPHHWIQLLLVGTKSERDAIGARATIHAGPHQLTEWVMTGDGYLGKNEFILHFGLADAAEIESLEVHWPSGEVQHWTDLKVDRRLLLIEGHSDLYALSRNGSDKSRSR